MVGHAVYLFDARIRRQAEFLAEQGYETHVVCCRNPLNSAGRFSSSYDSVNGVHIHNLPISKIRGNKLRYIYEFVVFTILSTVKVALMNLRKRFQVVHIHNMPDILVLAGLIPKLTGSVVVLDIHDPMSELFLFIGAGR